MENTSNKSLNDCCKNVKEAFFDLTSKLKDAGSQASHTAAKVVEDMGEAGKDAMNSCTEKAQKEFKNLQGYIANHPFKSATIAFAGGILLNKIFCTNSSCDK